MLERLSYERSSHKTWEPVPQEITVQERGCCSTADYPKRCNTPAGLPQQAVPGERYLGQVLTIPHPTLQDPAQYHEYDSFIHPVFVIYPIEASLFKVWICGTRERALARALGPFRGNNTWLSRIRVRRVAHAVLWGDGLRFRVSERRAIALPPDHSHSLRPWALCVVPRQARLCGLAISFGWLPCLGDRARQQIRTSRWRVPPGRALGAWYAGDERTHVHMYTRAHKLPRARTMLEIPCRPSVWSLVASARPTIERRGHMMIRPLPTARDWQQT